MKLPGVKRMKDGKETDYWPICESCRPLVWMRYQERFRKNESSGSAT